MATVVTEEDVSVEALDALFRQAFFRTRIDGDGDLYLTDGLEFPIWVRIDPFRKLIRLFTVLHCDPSRQPPFTTEAANRLNTSVVLPTFSVLAAEPYRLFADYVFSYRGGVIDGHVVGLARRFAGAVLCGARLLDEMDRVPAGAVH